MDLYIWNGEIMILNGEKISKIVKEEVRSEVLNILNENNKNIVCLAVILVGNNNASKIYIKNKKKACKFTKISSIEYNLPFNTKEEDLLYLIDRLNNDKNVNGILVQLPIPSHINENKVISHISPLKDVDGFTPFNMGKLVENEKTFIPCTAYGILELLKQYSIKIDGMNCTVIGRSNIVGKPIAQLLLNENATVSICHSHTRDLSLFTKSADIIICSVGKAKFLTKDYVKKGATVIDVGINRDDEGKLTGDVNFDEVKEIAKYITPVPGGVGPMTVSMLMKNVLLAYKNQRGYYDMQEL